MPSSGRRWPDKEQATKRIAVISRNTFGTTTIYIDTNFNIIVVALVAAAREDEDEEALWREEEESER